MSACRSCEAPIVWAQTTDGKAIPLDGEDQGGYTAPAPDPDGPALYTGRRVMGRFGGTVMVVRIVPVDGELFPGDEPADSSRFRPHFATCPDAEEWRQ